MTSKTQLRTYLKKVRQDFVKKQNIQNIFDSNCSVLNRILASAFCIAGYQKVGSEVSAEALMIAVDAHDVMIALPFIGARGEIMCFKQWRRDAPLVETAYGFLQPMAEAPDVTPDIILVPLVGFDRAMNRIGQGAGHYDRFFTTLPGALRIGLAWSCQECPKIPTDPWDIPLDAVLTEKEWIKPVHSRIMI